MALEVQNVVSHLAGGATEGEVDLNQLANRLALLGMEPVVRSAPGGGHGESCFRNLPYRFISIGCSHLGSQEDQDACIIVDPNFK